MSPAGWTLAYHGCDAALGEAVLRGEEVLRPSENDHDWLGTGIYFWEGDATRALEWAQAVKERPALSKTRIASPFVLVRSLTSGRALT